ncbi:hypothetical protein GGR57DRAFT_519501 [Xylariaceae sp. FL1272]|nr:hypothetical protein GGR57DRAFT_519501 [Xylariaceae sp. FL1272]
MHIIALQKSYSQNMAPEVTDGAEKQANSQPKQLGCILTNLRIFTSQDSIRPMCTNTRRRSSLVFHWLSNVVIDKMRLIDVNTLDFVEISEAAVVSFAILSHTWSDGQEVSLQDWNRWRAKEPGWSKINARSGLQKILKACVVTQGYELEYLWVDTNCIDKLSSAELSEAINSMFAWYSQPYICLAYLADVHSVRHGNKLDMPMIQTEMRKSRWFTRGWTLQELLAPRTIQFFTDDWVHIGTKASLSLILASITDIEEQYLLSEMSIHDASIGTRMSWAALRQTSRVEDQAYSLLGLFDINMPLLYGEGEKAFMRLQEEILKVSTDKSIFAWRFVEQSDRYKFQPYPSWVSFLAPHPVCFLNFSLDLKNESVRLEPTTEIWAMTNIGLTMHLPLLATTGERHFFAVLHCDNFGTLVCIPVIRIKDGQDRFIRATWAPEPIKLRGLPYHPNIVALYAPRHPRRGYREEFWYTPTFEQTPTSLVVLATSGLSLVTERRATSSTVTFYPDVGCLQVANPFKGMEGMISRCRIVDAYHGEELMVCILLSFLPYKSPYKQWPHDELFVQFCAWKPVHGLEFDETYEPEFNDETAQRALENGSRSIASPISGVQLVMGFKVVIHRMSGTASPWLTYAYILIQK